MRPDLEYLLHEAAKNKFLAKSDRNHHSEKRDALGAVLRKYAHGELRQNAFHFFRMFAQFAKREDLVREDQGRKAIATEVVKTGFEIAIPSCAPPNPWTCARQKTNAAAIH